MNVSVAPARRLVVDGVHYVLAHPVAEGRCESCGSPLHGRHWTPPLILDALRAAAVDGLAPPRDAWAAATVDHPADATVIAMFGTWSAAVWAAGLRLRRPGGVTVWSRERIVEAMHDFYERTGERPTVTLWRKAEYGRPTAACVKDHFGTFNAALEAAGFFMYGPYGTRITSPDESARRRELAATNHHRTTARRMGRANALRFA